MSQEKRPLTKETSSIYSTQPRSPTELLFKFTVFLQKWKVLLRGKDGCQVQAWADQVKKWLESFIWWFLSLFSPAAFRLKRFFACCSPAVWRLCRRSAVWRLCRRSGECSVLFWGLRACSCFVPALKLVTPAWSLYRYSVICFL